MVFVNRSNEIEGSTQEMMKVVRIILITFVVILVIMILKGNAVGAAHLTKSIGHELNSFASGLSTFFANL